MFTSFLKKTSQTEQSSQLQVGKVGALLLVGSVLGISQVFAQTPEGIDVTGFSCTADQVTIPQSECEALVNFYENTNGDEWNEGYHGDESVPGGAEAWLTEGTDPCDWYGVTCYSQDNMEGNWVENVEIVDCNGGGGDESDSHGESTNNHVIKVGSYDTFTENNLQGTIGSGDVWSLPNLVSLGLHGNKITTFATVENFTGTALRRLDLGNNKITTIPIGTISSYTGLAYFDWSSNGVTGTFPTAIAELPNIKEFNIENNEFTGGLPDFPNITSPYGEDSFNGIEYFDVSGNGFDGTLFGSGDASIFSGITGLNNVDLSNNLFTGRMIDNIGTYDSECSNKVFSIANNDLDGAIPDLTTVWNQIDYDLRLNGTNYICGDYQPESLADGPLDDHPDDSESKLCKEGTYCEDGNDCYSGSCSFDSDLGYNTCDPAPDVECGSAHSTDPQISFYRPDEPQPENLCVNGTSSEFIYTENEGWTWTCSADYGDGGIVCQAFESYCGDGIADGVEVEQCDGSDLNGETCQTQGFDGGTLSCNSSCDFDTTQCESAVNGACGSANTTTMTSTEYNNKTETELCSSGTYESGSPNPNGGNWEWNCNGTYSGTDDSCSGIVDTGDATCGDAAGESYYPGNLSYAGSGDTTLCSDGSDAPDLSNDGETFTWTCDSNPCSALVKEDGQCGVGVPNPTDTKPTSNLCDGGTPTEVTTTSTQYTWTCTGDNGGVDSSLCAVAREPKCADLTGQEFTDSSEITDQIGCDFGTIDGAVTQSGAVYQWNCTNEGFDSPTCEADKYIPALTCNEIGFQLTLTDLGYSRNSAFISEDFYTSWDTYTQSGTVASYSGITFNGQDIGTGTLSHTGVYNYTGSVNYVFDLVNEENGNTKTCTYPISVQAYQHSKTAYAVAVDTGGGQDIITYRIASSMPEGNDLVTFSDRITTGQGSGFVDIIPSSIRLYDASGEYYSSNFEIVENSIVPHSTTTGGTTYIDGFDMVIQGTTDGIYGDFVVEYEAILLDSLNGDICNTCEIEGDWYGVASDDGWLESVFAQSTYIKSDGVCIDGDTFTSGDPTCQACDYEAGYNPCPGREADPNGGTGQTSQNVSGIGQCDTVDYCGCYFSKEQEDASCDYGSLVENGVACQPTSPTVYNQQFVFDPSDGDYTTCAGLEECGMVCEDGAVYSGSINNGEGGCLAQKCDNSTLPDIESLPSGASIVECVDDATELNQSFTEINEDNCGEYTEGCYYYIDCPFGETYNISTDSCEPDVEIQKTGEEINASTGMYTIKVAVGAVTGSYTIEVDDALTDNPHSDDITDVTITNRSGITGGSCTINGTNDGFTCDGFTVTTPENGGEFTVEVTLAGLTQGGDDEICNQATVTVNDATGSDEATDDDCISGYNISVEKVALTGYDSGKGGSLNTYPPNIASGELYHGDWVVYEIVAQNDGPQDAWSPKITDDLPNGLTLIDYLTGTTTSTGATIDAVNWSIGGSQINLLMSGKYHVGDTTTLRFSAKFDQGESDIPQSGGKPICNPVEAFGQNEETEKIPGDNVDEACLDVPACQERQCIGEIYGTDFVRERTGTGDHGTVTIDGWCESEGTCEISDKIPTTTASLTYSQCSGSYATSQDQGSGDWVTQISGDNGKTTTVNWSEMGDCTSGEPTESCIQTAVNNFLEATYKEGNYDLADEMTLSTISGTSGSFTFNCRSGSPILTCEKPTCDASQTLGQTWIVGGPEWTPIENVEPPAEGSQAPQGTGSVENFVCNTCDEGPPPPPETCPEPGEVLIIDQDGNASCGECVECGCCQNGADLTAEVDIEEVNGERVYNVIDVFCPEPPEAEAPYPPEERNYDFYPGTDTDGDGKPDLCVQYDKSIVSVDGNIINYEISGFLGGSTGSTITITDQLDISGMYENDFTLSVSEGTGSLTATVNNNTATLEVTKNSGANLSFTITYSVEGSWNLSDPDPLCNDIEFVAGDTTIQDTECACPEDYEYCGVTEQCITESSPCGYDKEITAINGDQISYKITAYVPVGQTSLEIIDTIENASYNDDFVLEDLSGSGTLMSTINGSSVTLDITKTSTVSNTYNFSITYSATADWSGQGGGDPNPVCNEVFFTDGSNTLAQDDECACPTDYAYCPVSDTCLPEGDPCGFDKEITAISGSVVSYEITGYVPAGSDEVTINDTVDSGTYNNDFALSASQGSGTMNATLSGGNSVEITVTKTSAIDELMIFTVTYSATVVRNNTSAGVPIPVCNDIEMDNTGTGGSPTQIGTDNECACSDGYNYCTITDSCIPEGDPCGYDKTLTGVDGNVLSYEIEGTVPDNANMIIITDTIENATFNNDFTYTSIEGTGTFTYNVSGQTVELRVDRVSPQGETVRFTISYTTTAEWVINSGTTEVDPVCNEVNIASLDDDAASQNPIDEICECPESFYLCSTTNTCLLEGEPCGSDKRITSISGSTINYTIGFTLEETQQDIVITDVLSGATYNTGSFSLSTSPNNSGVLSTAFSGNSAEMTVTRTGIAGEIITGEIEYTATAAWAQNPTDPVQVCNDVTFEDDGSTTAWDDECVCPTGFEYCAVTEECITAGDPCGSQSYCNDLTITPEDSASAPFNPMYSCSGTGTVTLVELYDPTDQVIFSGSATSGTFSIPGTGTYTALCSYDGDTGLECGNGPFSVEQLRELTNDIRDTIYAEGGDYENITWSEYFDYLDVQSYLDISREELIDKLKEDTEDFIISDAPGSFPPSGGGGQSGFESVISSAVVGAVDSNCQVEQCVVDIDVGGGGESCDDLTTTDDLDVTAPTHSVDFTCVSVVATGGLLAEIDCGNAIGTGNSTILTGTTSETGSGSGIFGFEGTCNYTRGNGTTTFSPTCAIAGMTSGSCTEDVILRSGGGRPGGICGDGIVDPGEDCDDGNNNNNDSCPNDCELGGGPGGSSSGGSSGGSGGGGGGGGNPCGPNDIIFPGFCIENEPKCAEIDPPSIQEGEYLPFWWDLELGEEVDKDANSCGQISQGKSIPAGSLSCTFEIYNGSSDDPIVTLPNLPCTEDRWAEDNTLLFQDYALGAAADQMGKSFIKISEDITGGTYGEYQIVLSKVNYTACGPGGSSAKREAYRGTSDNRICAMNFAVSDGYMIQQGSSLATKNNTDLSAYKYLDGSNVVSEAVLETVDSTKLTEFSGQEHVKSISAFVEQYIPLAVKYTKDLSAYTNQGVKKTVNENVYLYEGGPARVPLTISEGTLAQKNPKTVIVKDADLVVEGSVYGNILWVVPDGKVQFKNLDCDMYDLVQGFYVANQGFESVALMDGEIQPQIRNNDLGAFEWCEDGRLVIDGFLIGPGLDSPQFIESRRALLDQWFNVSNETQVEKIFEGAAILFKTNTGLWSYLPQGVSKFKDIVDTFR